jgi:phage shock protein PspC (stress-responsive transcriptional regulator)
MSNHLVVMNTQGATMEGLYRPSQGKMIAGVCAGLARRFGMSPNVVRLLAIISCLLPGPQFVVYIVLWIMMPTESKYHATRHNGPARPYENV